MTEVIKNLPGLLTEYKFAPENLGRVLVCGLGKSGTDVMYYLVGLMHEGRLDELSLAAGALKDADEETLSFVEDLRECGVRVEFDHETIEGTYDLCIISPGIPQTSAFYKSAKAASAELISEVEFAWRESKRDSIWIAVTGTNGKTTTTALIAHVLRTMGFDARAVGNIGSTCIEAVGQDKDFDSAFAPLFDLIPDAEELLDGKGLYERFGKGKIIYVAEVSSYQLASSSRFAPNIAVLLNITPDHIAWHGSFESYCEAKFKILENLPTMPNSLAILDATNDIVRARVRELREMTEKERGYSYIPIGTSKGLNESMTERCGSDFGAYVCDGELCLDIKNGYPHTFGKADDLKIKGPHNITNALAAASTTLLFGIVACDVKDALMSFEPLEHRVEPCGSIKGVACYNDSKATNVDATLVALSSFEQGKIVALLGGRDKGTDLAPLVEHARTTCKAVVLFGESRDRFAEAFLDDKSSASQSALQVLLANHLEDALDVALEVAQEGDVVLLSPACASFDEFSCFEERGDTFKRLVSERADAADTGAAAGAGADADAAAFTSTSTTKKN